MGFVRGTNRVRTEYWKIRGIIGNSQSLNLLDRQADFHCVMLYSVLEKNLRPPTRQLDHA